MQSHSLKRNIVQFSGYVWAENEVIYVLCSVTPFIAFAFLCKIIFYNHGFNIILIATFLWSLLVFHTTPYCIFPFTNINIYIHGHNISSSLFFCLQQEKQRIRVKEKLDKCVKEKLMDFCDVLNIQINKAGTKKVSSQRNDSLHLYDSLMGHPLSYESHLQEELSAKLLEFLESPHATTDVLLAEKEQVLSFPSLFYLLFVKCPDE